MILVIGEILVDRIGNEKDGRLDLTANRGGAALNVASDLADLRKETVFYGVVGKDVLGSFLSDSLKKCPSFFHPKVAFRKDKETTIAFYLKDKGTFQFIRKNGADYDFSLRRGRLFLIPSVTGFISARFLSRISQLENQFCLL